MGLLHRVRKALANADLPSIEPYRVLREIGRGGMGVVYEAELPATGEHVAIKVIPPGDTDERFRREAQIAWALRHPNIVAVRDIRAPYIVMDYVDGAPLDAWLPRLPRRRRLQIFDTVARAVGFAHAQGVIHRDLKPANVLVAKDGRVLLTDFGLARREGSMRLTATGTAVGTPEYMAPEQLRGEHERMGPWTDVWALGVMLHEILAGRRPFSGDTPHALFRAVTRGRLPVGTHPVVRRALAKEPSARWANGTEMADALLRYRPRRWPWAAAAAGVALAGALLLRPAPPKPPPMPPPQAVAPAPPPAVPFDGVPLYERALADWRRWVDGLRRDDRLRASVTRELEAALAGLSGERERVARGLLASDRALLAGHLEALGEIGTFEEREATHAEEIARDASNVRHWLGRGRLHLERAGATRSAEDFGQAEADFTEALRLSPGRPEALRLRGEGRLWRGDLPEAEEDLDAAVAADAGDAHARHLRGILWSMRADRVRRDGGDPSGEWSRAESELSEALRLDESRFDARLLRARMLFERGRRRQGAGQDPMEDLGRGESDCSEVLRTGAPAKDALLLRADCRYHMGNWRVDHNDDPGADWGGAEADATEALRLDPQSVLALVVRGNVRSVRASHRPGPRQNARRRADWQGAAADYEAALALDPSLGPSVEAWLRRAREGARGEK